MKELFPFYIPRQGYCREVTPFVIFTELGRTFMPYAGGDKTKETKKIKVTPKIGKISDLDSDGLNSGEKNPKADCKIVYTVYSIK